VSGSIRAVRLGVLAGGAAAGALTLAVVRRSPDYAIAGGSAASTALSLAAGWSVLIAGVIALGRRARRPFGVVAAVASWAWFAAQWNTPGAGSAWVFTAGLVLATVVPVLVADAGLRYLRGRVGAPEIAALAAGGLATVGLAVAGALFFDPASAGCYGCPANLLMIADRPAVAEQAGRLAVHAGVIWPVMLGVVLAWRLARTSPAGRGIAGPVAVPVLAYLVVVELDYLHSWSRGYLGADDVDRRLWAVQAGLLIVAALGTGWSYVHRRRTRSAVARMVVAASDVSAPGGLEKTLGTALGDDSLRVFYPHGADGWVNAAGYPVERHAGRGTTRLTRDGVTIAFLTHRREALDEDGIADEIAGAAGLALTNERLRAQRRAQLADLRASRARIVEAADAERRRLERDLHDGAQQRIVALSLALRLEQLRLGNPAASGDSAVGAAGGDPPGAGGDAGLARRLEEAQAEVAATLAGLRRLARGLYPRELADEGLSAALETLAESSGPAVTLDVPVDGRFPAPVEAVAYFTVANRLAGGGVTHALVSVRRDGDRLRAEIEDDGPAGDTTAIEDRVGALAGTLSVEARAGGGTRIRAELPCGS